MAMVKSHWKNGFWARKEGYEYPLTLLAVGIAIGLTGPGSFALDALFGMVLPNALLFCVLALATVVVNSIGLLISRPAAMRSPDAA